MDTTTFVFRGATLAKSQVIGIGPLLRIGTDTHVFFQFRLYFRQYSELIESARYWKHITLSGTDELQQFKDDYIRFSTEVIEHLNTAVI
jgi:hypothetical protein